MTLMTVQWQCHVLCSIISIYDYLYIQQMRNFFDLEENVKVRLCM